MGLFFIHGCDFYGNGVQIVRRWETNDTSILRLAIGVMACRWSGRAIQLFSSNTGRIIRHIPPRQTVILTFPARITRIDSSAVQGFIILYEPSAAQIAIDSLEVRYRCHPGWFDAKMALSATDVARALTWMPQS